MSKLASRRSSIVAFALSAVIATSGLAGAQSPATNPPSAKTDAVAARIARVADLEKEFTEASKAESKAFEEALGANENPTREQLTAAEEKSKPFAPDRASLQARARAIVAEDPADAAALKAIEFQFKLVYEPADRQALVDQIEEHHRNSVAIGDLCRQLMSLRPKFVTELSEKSPHASVRGKALAAILDAKRAVVTNAESLKKLSGDELEQTKQRLGAERSATLLALDVAAANREILELCERIAKDYAEVSLYAGTPRETTLGAWAKTQIHQLKDLALGCVTPEIEAVDLDGVNFKLSDYRGRVVLLDFWGFW